MEIGLSMEKKLWVLKGKSHPPVEERVALYSYK